MTSSPHETESHVGLRPALASDEPLLLKLYASTRQAELSYLPLNAEQLEGLLKMQFVAQHRSHMAQHPQAEQQIILFDEQAIGRILLDRLEDRFHLVDITLLPEFRGRGIGSTLLKSLQAEAAREGKSFRLFVYQTNVQAIRLYERLGFSRAGESGMYVEMMWRAES